MTSNPSEFEQGRVDDSSVLDGARARLELALGDPSPAVAALLERLETGEGGWAEGVLGETLGEAQGLGGRVAAEFWVLAERAAGHSDPRARLLLGCALAAAHWEQRASPPPANAPDGSAADDLLRSTERASLSPDDLLDIASFLPGQWCELFVRAARALRGDPPEHETTTARAKPGDGGSEHALGSELIGGYRLLEPLGRGSFGTVYRAVDVTIDRQVALKLLRPEVFSSHAERRFLEEGRILSTLSHPGIAGLFRAGFDTHLGIRLPYLAMELVRGCSIVRYATEERLTVVERLRLIVQASDALHHAHLSHVVHRDVHPGNLIVRDDGTLKVLDFGAAFAPSGVGPSTRSGVLFGALAYISPEQARADGGEVDARADVFGLGAVLFELLSGETPHALGNLTLKEALDLVTEGTPRRLRAVVSDADRDLDAICAKALAEDRDERYPSTQELGQDLRRFKSGLAVEARPPSFANSVLRLARRHRREAAFALVGLFLIGVLSVVAAVGWHNASLRTAEAEGAREQSDEMVVSVLKLAEYQADKLGRSWDTEAFYRAWSEKLDLMRIEDLGIKSTFLELLGRHAIRGGDFERAAALRSEVLANRRQLLAQAIEAGEDTDRPTRELSKALVRLGDTYWTRLVGTGRVEGRGEEVDAQVQEARHLFQAALDLDLALVERSPKPGHLDDLVWSFMRLYDLELRRGRDADEYLFRGASWSRKLLALDPDRPHSHFAAAELGFHFLRRARRQRDPAAALRYGEEALIHASRAFHAEPDRVPFLRSYQRGLNDLVVTYAADQAHQKNEVLAEDGPLFRALALAQGWVSDAAAWRNASGFYLQAARAAGRGGQPFVAGFLYTEAARPMREAMVVAAPADRWMDELSVAWFMRNAAAEFELAGRPGLAAALWTRSDESIGSVRASGIHPELLALAEQLLFGSPPTDPCDLLEGIRNLQERPELRAEGENKGVFARLLLMAQRRCDH